MNEWDRIDATTGLPKSVTPKATSVRYTVTVWLTQPLEMDDDNDNPEDWLSRESKRTIERDILKRLTTMDGDADCEVLDAELLPE
jgi:hypothetical protein